MPTRHLGPGHVHAEADVGSAAEGERRLDRPGDVVVVGPLPAGGVAVGGADAQVQHRPLGQVDAVEVDVRG